MYNFGPAMALNKFHACFHRTCRAAISLVRALLMLRPRSTAIFAKSIERFTDVVSRSYFMFSASPVHQLNVVDVRVLLICCLGAHRPESLSCYRQFRKPSPNSLLYLPFEPSRFSQGLVGYKQHAFSSKQAGSILTRCVVTYTWL